MQVVLVSNINHMRSFSLFLLTTVLSLSTFAQSDKVDVHGFKNEYELEKFLTPIDIQGQIFQAHAMASDGKYFFVTNDKEVPPIKSYRLSDGKFMGGFGSIGGGPGEFTILNRSGFGIRKGQLVVQGRKYVRIYDLVEKKDKLDFELANEIKIPGDMGNFNNGFLLNDNTLAASVMFSPKDFITFRLNPSEVGESNDVGDFGDYPNLYPDIPSTAYHHLYTGGSDYSQDGNYLVRAYSRLPLIRVFDLKDHSFQEIELKPKNEQISKLVPDQRGKSIANGIEMFNYQGLIKISNNFIVSFYQEELYKRTAMTERGNMEAVPQTDRFLLVFSREGELLAKLSPPDWFQRFILTPDNKMILFHPEIENKLFVADLDQFR